MSNPPPPPCFSCRCIWQHQRPLLGCRSQAKAALYYLLKYMDKDASAAFVELVSASTPPARPSIADDNAVNPLRRAQVGLSRQAVREVATVVVHEAVQYSSSYSYERDLCSAICEVPGLRGSVQYVGDRAYMKKATRDVFFWNKANKVAS